MNTAHRLVTETPASGLSGHQIVAALYNNAGFVLHQRNSMENAMRMYQEAVSIRRESLAPSTNGDTRRKPVKDAKHLLRELTSLCQAFEVSEEELLRSRDLFAPTSPLGLFHDASSLAETDHSASAPHVLTSHSRPLHINKSDMISLSNFNDFCQGSAVTLYNMGLWHCQAASTAGLSPKDQLTSLESAAQLLRMAIDVSPMPAQVKDYDVADYRSLIPMRHGIDAPSETHHLEVSILAFNALGMVVLRLGRPKEALRYLSEAYKYIASPSTAPSDELVMATLSNLSHVHHALGQHVLASGACAAILQLLEGQETSLHVNKGKAVILHNLATSFRHSSKLDRALQTYAALLSYVRSVPTNGEDFDKTTNESLRFIEVDTLRRTGHILSDCSRPDQGARALLESLRVHTSYNGMSDLPFLASTVLDLGRSLLSSGQVSKSIQAFTRACALARRAYGPDHVHVTAALYSLGRVHQIIGDIPASLRCYSKALDGIRRRLAGLAQHVRQTEPSKREDSMLLVELLRTMGTIHMEAGDEIRAAMILEEACTVERGVAFDDNGDEAQVEEGSNNNSQVDRSFRYSDIHEELDTMLERVNVAPAA